MHFLHVWLEAGSSEVQVTQKPYLSKFVPYIFIFNSGYNGNIMMGNGVGKKIELKTPFLFFNLLFKYIKYLLSMEEICIPFLTKNHC